VRIPLGGAQRSRAKESATCVYNEVRCQTVEGAVFPEAQSATTPFCHPRVAAAKGPASSLPGFLARRCPCFLRAGYAGTATRHGRTGAMRDFRRRFLK
jgi:hypothetical protein